MEDWQRRYIFENMYNLCENTKCSSQLIVRLQSLGVLEMEDSDLLDDDHVSDIVKTKCLYNKLLFKRDSYAALVKSLSECKQFLPLCILNNGTITMGLRQMKIMHSGTVKSIKHVIQKEDMEEITNKLLKFKDEERSQLDLILRAQSNENAAPMVVESKPPAKVLLYVDRELKLKKVESSVLNENFLDESLHTNPSSYNTKATSTATLPSIIEDEFMKLNFKEFNSTAISICGSPGIGKSCLLANVARKVEEEHQDWIVVFMPFTKLLSSSGFDPMKKMEYTSALSLIASNISNSALVQDILIKVLKNRSKHFVICLDGFDEIPPDMTEVTKEFLKVCTKEISCVKIITTTRHYRLEELESILEVTSYDILPFSEKNQLDYFVNHWQQNITGSSQSKLIHFGNKCLQNFKKSVTKEEQPVTDNPLHCFLLADVYTKEASLHSDPKRNPMARDTSLTFSYSMYQVYTKLMKMRFGKSLDRLDETAKQIRSFHVWMALKLLIPEIAEQYAKYTEVDKDVQMSECLKFGILEPDINGEDGIPKFVHKHWARFLIAEHFAVAFTSQESQLELEGSEIKLLKDFSEILFQTIPNGTFHLNLGLDIPSNQNLGLNIEPEVEKSKMGPTNPITQPLYAFCHPMIASFLNECLRPKRYIPLTVLVTTFLNSFEPLKLYKILLCCVINNHIFTFGFIKQMLICLAAYDDQMKKHREYLEGPCDMNDAKYSISRRSFLFCVVAEFSKLSLVRDCFELFRECFETELNGICNEIPVWMKTPLHPALTKGDYALVEYLVDKVSLADRSLLICCIGYSYFEPKEMAEERIEICKLLLKKSRCLLSEQSMLWNENFGGPLVADKVHCKVLKYLIEEGADLQASYRRETVVHRAAVYMSSVNFHDLCKFIIDHLEGKSPSDTAWNIFKPMSSKNTTPKEKEWECLMHHIFKHGRKLLSDTTTLILNIQGLDKKDEDPKGNNYILSAILGGWQEPDIRVLVDKGINHKHKNKRGRSALHLAAETGNIDLMKYFISLGLYINQNDINGLTPLLVAHQTFPVVEHLLMSGADINVTAENGQTIAHIAASSMPEHDFHNFMLYVLKTCKAIGIFKTKNQSHRTPLHERLQSGLYIDNDTLKFLLDIPGIEINAKDDKENNLFLSAIMGGQRVDVLQILKSYGAEVLDQKRKILLQQAEKRLKLYEDNLLRYIMDELRQKKIVELLSNVELVTKSV